MAERVKKKRSEREKIINDIIEEISISLKEHNIQGEISGRPKSLYSIYKKMYKQNKSFDEIFDKMIGNKKEVVIKRKNKAEDLILLTATRYKEILEKIEELKYYNEIRRRAEDLDAGNGKVHTISEMEKMLEAIK